ncbi:MAG: hypothetical protein ACFB3T_14525 [Geminicoccaceae bacterium]
MAVVRASLRARAKRASTILNLPPDIGLGSQLRSACVNVVRTGILAQPQQNAWVRHAANDNGEDDILRAFLDGAGEDSPADP